MEYFFILLYILLGIFLILCFVKIAQKAGYSPWFGLLIIIPLVNLIVLAMFAFETWPILKPKDQRKSEKVARLRKELEELTSDQEIVEKGEQVDTHLELKYSPEILSCPTCKYADIEDMNTNQPWCNAPTAPDIKNNVCSTFMFKSKQPLNSCPDCGNKISKEMKFCRQCGKKLSI